MITNYDYQLIADHNKANLDHLDHLKPQKHGSRGYIVVKGCICFVF